ncbi:LacI family DNA-binding transcriptional regulator [Pantoea sp. At-9b]|uniref:LacI family DNA-binding transcriptional regulator n=1 Tax=Pantoea sp. (strain At-9b) TaxID=592316 RepID=UPI0001B407AD|nr:LacI family DNA-binding transcriptional regulator [Pantoea sp. At-9b]ADU72809.1 transcriptional regulator, LacI family [Pantoea sp. At-9b]
MITMLDVAQRAGVSKATVSRVLAGHSYVSKTVRDKVMQAVDEMGYRPNLVARNLATNRSHSIGLMVPNTLYHGPFFSELMFQVATLTEQLGSQLVLADGKHNAQQERDAIHFLIDSRCDAVIIYPRYLSVEEIDALIPTLSKPLIILNRRLKKFPQYSVCADHEKDTCDAVNYLIRRGHRDIAFIKGMGSSHTGLSRLKGFQAAMTQNNLPMAPALMLDGCWTMESGKRAAEELLARNVTFSAIVASNDDMAIGAASALHNAGKRMPQDVSLLSFDDIPMASYTIPALTSVHVPMAEMVSNALAQLTKMLDGEEVAALPLMCGELIHRQSVCDGPYA